MEIIHGKEITIEEHGIYFEENLLIANPRLPHLLSDVIKPAKIYLIIISNGYKFLFIAKDVLYFEKIKEEK